MKEKHPGGQPVVKTLTEEEIFENNKKKIKEKIRTLGELSRHILLNPEEITRFEGVIQLVGHKWHTILNRKRSWDTNHEMKGLANELDIEIAALEKKIEERNTAIEIMTLAGMEKQLAKKLDALPESLFHYLFENADRFASDAVVREEAEQFIESYYTELVQLMGHDLGEKDFQRTLTIFYKLKLQYNLDKDKWTKMLGMLLDADTLRTPEGIGTWLRANSYLSKKFINSNVAELTNKDIVNIFKIAFSNDEVRKKFKDNLPQKESNELGIQTALFNGFETIIFPHRDPFTARPDNISSERCQALAVAVQTAVFVDEPKVQAEQSKEQEKEEENSGARLSAGLQKIKENAAEVERLTDSVEKTRSPSNRLSFSSDLLIAPDSPISSKKGAPSPCRVETTPTGEVETKSALVK